MLFLDAFTGTLARGDKTEFVSALSGKDIGDFIQSFEWSLVKVQKAFEFLSDYVSFLQKEQPELPPLADDINRYCLNRFQTSVIEYVINRKKEILLIPADVVVDPKYLGGLTNAQFVSTFKELQKMVIGIYQDVEKSPFVWGYPDYYATDGFFNRVIDFLFAFILCGEYNNETIF